MWVDIDRLAAMYVDAGLTVAILPGAHRRAARLFASSGYADGGPRGSCIHHTAQPTTWTDAQSIGYLSGTNHPNSYVMTNVWPHKDTPGKVTIIAAGPTYTEGRGGPIGSIPLDKGNNHTWSMECPNNGVGERWPVHLQETMVTLSAVHAEFFGWEAERGRFFAHFEYAPTRKIDPFGPSKYTEGRNEKWDMDAFRADVYVRHSEMYRPDPEPPSEEDDMPKICAQHRVDSRASAYHTTLQAGEVREVWLTLPAGAVAAVINCVFLPKQWDHRGWVSVGGLQPTEGAPGTTVNWSQGDTVAQSQMTVLVTEGKKIYLQGNRDTEFIIDVTGLYW